MTSKIFPLHDRIADLPHHWQELIVQDAIGQFTSQIAGDEIEAYLRLRDSDDEVNLDDLGIIAWEPFENYDNTALWEVIDNYIYGAASFVKALGAPELLEALEKIILILPPSAAKDSAYAAIAKAKVTQHKL